MFYWISRSRSKCVRRPKWLQAAEGAGVNFMMAYLIRFLPSYKKAKELIVEGAIGRPLSMRIGIRCPLNFIRDNPNASEPGWYTDPQRGGAGGFLDHGIHYADALRFLLGTEPVQAFGKVTNLTDHRIAVDDYGVCVVTTSKGEIVTIESTWHAPAWYAPLTSQEECLIVGTDGEIHVHYQRSPQLEVSGKGTSGRQYYDWLGEERYEVCYRDALLEFADSIRAHREPSVTGEDGRIALRLIEAVYESSKSGKAIDLNPDDRRLEPDIKTSRLPDHGENRYWNYRCRPNFARHVGRLRQARRPS